VEPSLLTPELSLGTRLLLKELSSQLAIFVVVLLSISRIKGGDVNAINTTDERVTVERI